MNIVHQLKKMLVIDSKKCDALVDNESLSEEQICEKLCAFIANELKGNVNAIFIESSSGSKTTLIHYLYKHGCKTITKFVVHWPGVDLNTPIDAHGRKLIHRCAQSNNKRFGMEILSDCFWVDIEAKTEIKKAYIGHMIAHGQPEYNALQHCYYEICNAKILLSKGMHRQWNAWNETEVNSIITAKTAFLNEHNEDVLADEPWLSDDEVSGLKKIIALLEEYTVNKKATITQIRKDLGYNIYDAAAVFVLCLCMNEGILA